jgi:hypothetical protein
MVRLRPVLPCHHSLVDLRVERLPQTFYRFFSAASSLFSVSCLVDSLSGWDEFGSVFISIKLPARRAYLPGGN